MFLSSKTLLCSYHYHKYQDLIVDLRPRRHGFDERQIPVEFLVAKVTLDEVVLRIIRILQVSVISPRPPMLTFHLSTTDITGDTRWSSRLAHSATSRKVAGSIRDGVIGIFYCHNPSASAANRNEYQEYFLEGKDGRCLGLDDFTISMFPLS